MPGPGRADGRVPPGTRCRGARESKNKKETPLPAFPAEEKMTRILVADDDRTTRLLLSETLRAQKYTIVCVEDGAAALKKMNAGKFDLVLLDIWMPKMNGLEVLKKLRNAKKRPKVIVM